MSKVDMEEVNTLVAEFYARGGSIKKIPAGMKSNPETVTRMWGKPKKKEEPVPVVEEVKPKKEKKAKK